MASLTIPLGGQLAPLASTPAEALSAAPRVLSVLKLSVLEPTVVRDQVLTVATGLTALDVPAIVHNLTLLPQKVAALDACGAHQIAGELNNRFSPLVKMAAAVDLTDGGGTALHEVLGGASTSTNAISSAPSSKPGSRVVRPADRRAATASSC
ncbi:hypothetical protein [Rhodococcus sp. 14C212]|uniref:hypothetical protein n=1 Tax=Rhodococcus sp. 14C212 TaxID=2711209 RepID=UPI00197DC437